MDLRRCADVLGAYTAARQIVFNYASGESTLLPVEIDNAKSTVASAARSFVSASGYLTSGYLGKYT